MRQAPFAPHLVRIVRGLLCAALALLPSETAAQQPALTAASALVIDGPPAPIPPSVVSRDAEGHATVRAIKLQEPLLLDGRLDDRLYRENDSFGDFVQQEPREGQPATEKTEVWVGYDGDAIYIGARLWESDSSKRVTSDMRRDANNHLKDALKKKEVSENDERAAQNEVQKMTDRHIVEIDKLLQEKEKELLAV